MKKPTEAELCLEGQLQELGLHKKPILSVTKLSPLTIAVRGTVNAIREYRFHKDRKWRFDFAVTHLRLAIEIEGGSYGTWDKAGRWQKGKQGRHHRPRGFQNDLDKYNEAAVLGWTVFRFSTQDVLTGKSKEILGRWLERPL